MKIELYHDNFQNFKRYNIPKAVLVQTYTSATTRLKKKHCRFNTHTALIHCGVGRLSYEMGGKDGTT